jgi:hypothetical protein
MTPLVAPEPFMVPEETRCDDMSTECCTFCNGGVGVRVRAIKDASLELFNCTENCSGVVVIGGAGILTASGYRGVLASSTFGATDSSSLGSVGAVVALISGPGDRDLSRTMGDPRIASGIDLGLGVGVVGAEMPNFSDTGQVFPTGVTVDCEDTELSRLCTNIELIEDVEPWGAFSEGRCDDAELRSGSLDSLLFFPNRLKC